MKERRASQKLSSKSIMDPNQNVKCKIVVVGDSQCGKTALLHVFAKDCFPEVSVTREALRGAAGGVPSLEESVRSLAVIFLFKVLLLMLSGYPPATLLGRESVREAPGLGSASTPGSRPPKLAGFSVGSRAGKPGWALGKGLRVSV